MKKNILTLLCFLNTLYLISQVPQIEWQNTIGGNRVDQLSAISKTLDGGYICGGWSWSDSINDKTCNAGFYIVKEKYFFLTFFVINLLHYKIFIDLELKKIKSFISTDNKKIRKLNKLCGYIEKKKN